MTSNFDRWEKDPFFSAAEEVQESADRMESTYRTWIHAKNETSGAWDLDELRRDLQTTLGTTKWQLDEFDRAVRSSYTSCSSDDDAKHRHRDFVIAIENQTSKVENSLKESSLSQGNSPFPWVRLDEAERNELALFLSGPSLSSTNKIVVKIHGNDLCSENLLDAEQKNMNKWARCSPHLVEWDQGETKMETIHGHRRAASAGADICSWKIAMDDVLPCDFSAITRNPPPRKVPSLSCFSSSREPSVSQFEWPKNGYKKLKLPDCNQETDSASENLIRGVNICYEKNKSCLDGCDEYYDKQLHGWYGTLQRELQRSQYHMQYSRPVQVVFSITLLTCLLVFLALSAF